MVQAGQIGSPHELCKDVSKWRSHLAGVPRCWHRRAKSGRGLHLADLFFECSHFERAVIKSSAETYIHRDIDETVDLPQQALDACAINVHHNCISS
jgi:hypothetical protein